MMTRLKAVAANFQTGGGPVADPVGAASLPAGRALRRERQRAWLRRLGLGLRRALATLHRIIGAPDYDAYLAHHAQHHDGCEPMSRDAFVQARLADRYSRPGSRCC